jgi:hypothetical protein
VYGVLCEGDTADGKRGYYGDRQIADGSCGGGVGDVGFLEVAADERGLALAAREV